MGKKELCSPCSNFQFKEYFFGLGCVKKGLQLGQMFIELCGKWNCSEFKEKTDVS